MPPGGGAQVAGQSQWGPLADWPTRVIGWVVDYLPSILVGFVTNIFRLTDSVFLNLIGFVLSFFGLAWWLYIGYLNGLGQSPGKKMQGMKVVAESNGQPIGGGMGIVRNLAHIVDACVCYIGFLWPLWDAKRQTFADKIVKTYVLVDQPKQPFSIDLYKPPANM